MKKRLLVCLMIVALSLIGILAGCTDNSGGSGGGDNGGSGNPSQVGDGRIDVTFVENGNGTGDVFTVTLYENSSTEYLLDRIPSANFPCDFDDDRTFAYHSSYALRNCPENQEEITSVKAGEIVLASGGQLRFYLDNVENVSYNMTKIGYIEDMNGFENALEAADSYAHSTEMNHWGNDIYFRIALH